MLPNAQVCLYPKSISEAVRLLADGGKHALILAGGSTAALSRDPGVTTLIDITRLGLDTVEQRGGEWIIGCNVRLQTLVAHRGLAGLWTGMLVDAAAAVGARPIRNAVTVGGNTVALFRWSDPPVALHAMDAQFDLIGPEGERTLGADEWFARHPRQLLRPAELLQRVRIRQAQEGAGAAGAFVKLARTAFDLSVVSAACCLHLRGGSCTSARIVIGGVRNMPQRASQAEQLLCEGALETDRIAQVARAARQQMPEAEDLRNSKQYRAAMVEVMVRRVIERALARGVCGAVLRTRRARKESH